LGSRAWVQRFRCEDVWLDVGVEGVRFRKWSRRLETRIYWGSGLRMEGGGFRIQI
jgi:hypothetical protein